MDITPGIKITDEMIDVYEDTQTAARLAGFAGGLRGWPLVQYQVRAGLIAVSPLLQEAAYQAGREHAARAIEEHAELAGWGEVWAQAVSIARGMDLRPDRASLSDYELGREHAAQAIMALLQDQQRQAAENSEKYVQAMRAPIDDLNLPGIKTHGWALGGRVEALDAAVRAARGTEDARDG